jgi:D-alanyl-D-alanine carboxypeptidase
MPGDLVLRKWLPCLFLAVLSVLIAGMAACKPAVPDPPPPQALPELPYAAQLQSALDEALQEGQGAHDLGISAVVLVPGYEPWLGVSGNSHPGAPLKTDMLFNMGSIAKSFEAALALQLAEEGALDLDQPITAWLPEYPQVDGRITVRQLLNHSSGVYNVFEHPDFPWVGPGVDYEKEWPIAEVFERFVGEPYGPPGVVQHYSSTNYLLLTAILERTTEGSVTEEISGRFLEPLGLDSTVVSMGVLPPARYSVAHPWLDVNGDGTLQDLSGAPQTWIASMTHPVLYATPGDMARWTAALHSQALYGEKRVLSEESLQQMLAIPETELGDPEGGKYGLGVVDFSDILGVPVIGHGGSALGYSAAALYLPEQEIALAWSINTGESPPELANELMNNMWTALSEVLIE